MPTVTELAVRGRPSLQGRLPARRGLADHLREPVPPGRTGQRRRRLGESLPRAYVSGERREGAFALLRDSILPALLGQTFQSLPDLISFLEKCDGQAPTEWVGPEVAQTSAWCSVDLALLDAFGRAFGEPVSLGGQPPAADALGDPLQRGGVRRPRVALCGVAAQDAGLSVPARQAEGRTGRALQAARTARRLLGRRVDLRVDANMAWNVEQALKAISQLRAVGIQSFEQPIAADDLAGLARLVAETSAQIVVDEGLTDRDSLQRFISHRACTGANVRISKCGGLVGAYARCREALDAGLMLQVGCQVGESSLLSAAHLTLLQALAPLTPECATPKAFGRHLLRRTPRHRWSSSATAAALRGGRPEPARGSGRSGGARAMGRRPGRRRLGR